MGFASEKVVLVSGIVECYRYILLNAINHTTLVSNCTMGFNIMYGLVVTALKEVEGEAEVDREGAGEVQVVAADPEEVATDLAVRSFIKLEDRKLNYFEDY